MLRIKLEKGEIWSNTILFTDIKQSHNKCTFTTRWLMSCVSATAPTCCLLSPAVIPLMVTLTLCPPPESLLPYFSLLIRDVNSPRGGTTWCLAADPRVQAHLQRGKVVPLLSVFLSEMACAPFPCTYKKLILSSNWLYPLLSASISQI